MRNPPRFQRTLFLIVTVLLLTGVFIPTGAATPAHAMSTRTASAKKATLPTVTRDDIMARAQSWVDAGVTYDQEGTYNGYREDCSGYVSMAWGLATPGLTTYTLPSVASPISKDDLQPGDILLNSNGGGNADFAHVVLFEGWVDSSHTSYNGYEEVYAPGYYIGAHHTTNVPYPYWSGYDPQDYVPMRLNTLASGAGSNVPSSQLVFKDYRGDVYSISISGPDQNGNSTTYDCLQTPDFETALYNWWWSSTTYVYIYSDSSCQNYLGYLYFNSDGATYRCLEDTPPYPDYDCTP